MQRLEHTLATLRGVGLRVRAVLTDDRGASATEYAVIVAIVVTALVGIGALFGQALGDLWDRMIAGIAGFGN
jgi:Flp pilus assembly pilin Flp